MEEITRIQKGYAIPDTELRDSMVNDNKEFILPKYEQFYSKYARMNFSKTPDKYLRYTVDDVRRCIEQLFDSAA